jgi:hypothetical protein
VEFDLVAYDSTPAGLSAAIAARRAGLSALVLSPYPHLGGLTTSGLGATDVGHPDAIGGLGREFYLRVAAHYAGGDTRWDQPGLSPQFRFEPKVAEALLEAWLAAEGVEVWRGIELTELRLESVPAPPDSPATLPGQASAKRIAALSLRDGRVITPGVVIDASYEGDLLPLAGVPCRVGREANAEYGESLNGVQFGRAVHHQFGAAVDAYLRPGEPESGLLPEVDGSPVQADGSGDGLLQAFCFRLCLTQEPTNRVPFSEPPGYDPERYELLLRWFDAGADWLPLHPVDLPNRKTDTNNNGPVSSDWIGGNRGWLAASLSERAEIAQQHQAWQAGLLWTLASHRRVNEKVRREAATWGLAADEFIDNGHWPYRLYVREGRRLVGDLVMSEAHCRGTLVAAEPIGLAAYTMDSHHVRRLVQNGQVWNEGDVQVGGFPPYPIGYRALLPPAGSVLNLGVPVCLSATHIAYGSIRMEPVFFVLGHALGQAAALAKHGNLQAVDYQQLRAALLAQGQVLEWPSGPAESEKTAITAITAITKTAATALDPSHLSLPPGSTLVALLDDSAAHFTGPWAESRASSSYLSTGYRHDAGSGGGRRAEWRLTLPSGRYCLELGFPPANNRAANTKVRWSVTPKPEAPNTQVSTSSASTSHGSSSPASNPQTLRIDQRQPGPDQATYRWAPLGNLDLEAPCEVLVEVFNDQADGIVVVDALRVSLLPPAPIHSR